MKPLLLFAFFLTLQSIYGQEEGITVKDGNVGIGTLDPQYPFHNYVPTGNINITNETDGPDNVSFRSITDSSEWNLQARNSIGGYNYRLRDVKNNINVWEAEYATGNIAFWNRVGIGTLSPLYSLHIQDTGTQILKVESTDNFATQLRLKTNLGNNRRFIGETASGSVKSQISLEDSEIKIYGPTVSTNPLNIKTDGSNNVGINEVTTFGTSSVGVIGLGEGTAPTTSPSDIVQLYVESDSSGSAELKVRDEAGNITVLSDSQVQDLSYNAGNREIEISSGSSATLPIFNNTNAGLVPSVSPDTTSFLRADGTWTSPSQPTTYLEDALSSDLSMSSSSNWYNGPSVTLTAGTWLVTCNLSFHKATVGHTNWYGRISTGSTHYSGGITRTLSGNPQRAALSMTSIVTVASSTTIYGQGRSSSSSVLMRAKVNHDGIFDVTNIVAVKLN